MAPPGAMGMPGGSPMGPGVPGAPGVPGDYAIEPPKGAVDAALSNGARFLGCINGQQKFVKRSGERVAFTAKEIRRSEEHTSELQSLMRISYAVFCLKKKKKKHKINT